MILRINVKMLSLGESFIITCLRSISYYIELSSLIMLTDRFSKFLFNMSLIGSIPRRAKHAEFEVLSGIPWICSRHFLWNFSKLSISFCLKSNASRPYSSRGMTMVDQMCPPRVALSPLPPCSPAPI